MFRKERLVTRFVGIRGSSTESATRISTRGARRSSIDRGTSRGSGSTGRGRGATRSTGNPTVNEDHCYAINEDSSKDKSSEVQETQGRTSRRSRPSTHCASDSSVKKRKVGDESVSRESTPVESISSTDPPATGSSSIVQGIYSSIREAAKKVLFLVNSPLKGGVV